MTTKKPVSFTIFIIVLFITALVMLVSSLCSYYRVDEKYAMILAFVAFIAVSFTTVGIYTGFKYRSEEKKTRDLNRVGLIGNVLIFLFYIGIMIVAIFMKTS